MSLLGQYSFLFHGQTKDALPAAPQAGLFLNPFILLSSIQNHSLFLVLHFFSPDSEQELVQLY